MRNRARRIAAVVGSVLCIAVPPVSCMKQATPAPGADAAGIEGIPWYLTEVGGSPVSPLADDRRPHILLDPSRNRATGFAGCNHFFGRYELDGSSLTFGPLGSTRMACPDLETGLETSVFEALERTRQWKRSDGQLLLLDGDDDAGAWVTRQDAAPTSYRTRSWDEPRPKTMSASCRFEDLKPGEIPFHCS